MNRNRLLINYWVGLQFGGAKNKWTTLEHNGVLFPPPYEPHGIPVLYQGQPIILEPAAEELATMYARYIESDYVKKRVFNKNFWNDWRRVLGKGHSIQNLTDVDFNPIYQHLLQMKIEAKADPIVEEARKKARQEIELKYKTAMVDGKSQPVGNFRVEPPSIFLGRGCNPQLGKVKPRIFPEDITINIGAGVAVPEPLQGHKWKRVIHDKSVEWLAAWPDAITGKQKYVWLGAQSDFRARNDLDKFELARKLGRKIKSIRAANAQNLNSPDMKVRQIATALYFIDRFALRVGNEKGEDEADTVGVTSLRAEHVEPISDNRIKLDFLGKDSVRYNRTLTVEPEVHRNITDFISSKKPTDQLFDRIDSTDVNKYLQEFMPNLTAKVFRTFNASHLFQKELDKITKKYDTYDDTDKINTLLDEFNRANARVALLCNHQKNINKSTTSQLKKLDDSIKATKLKIKGARAAKKPSPKRIEQLRKTLKKLQARKTIKTELKNISLGTSKINYIDPRITVAFMKKHQLPIEKIFTKTLQDKFTWALDTPVDFEF
ncbi:DNA topoisomerase 1 [uncultured virus]|nr:DNA topoisomerase 1 [uncultured virus]